jgi:hypothetical protein
MAAVVYTAAAMDTEVTEYVLYYTDGVLIYFVRYHLLKLE